MLVGDTLAIDVQGAQALKARVASGDRESLRTAAGKFEALMLGMVLKSMRVTRFSEEDDPMTSGEGVQLYRDLLDQQWAERIAAQGGVGFADMIVRAHAARQDGPAPAPARSTPPGAGVGETAAADVAAAPAMQQPAMQQPAMNHKQAFLAQMRPHADVAAAASGLPAEFILAHAALESGWGARQIRAADGSATHNLFGIKAGRGWDGAAVEITTTEYRAGLAVKLEQRFRAYADYTDAFADYAQLIKSRYGAAVAADAHEFATALAAGGYASDPAYADKLEAVIASVRQA